MTQIVTIQAPPNLPSSEPHLPHRPSVDLKQTPYDEIKRDVADGEVTTEDDIDNKDNIDTDDDGVGDANVDISEHSADNNWTAVHSSEGPRPGIGKAWLYPQLENLVAAAKGAAAIPVVRFIKKFLRGTKLIFVVGGTGTGKSTFLSEVTGQKLFIGTSHSSGTKQYYVCPGIIEDEQYLFIDTAGFGAADINDKDNFQDIIACLDALRPFVTIAGLLLVLDGTQGRLTDSDLRTIQWVKCFCGPEFYRFITVVATMWDKSNDFEFKKSWARFQGLLSDPKAGIKDMLDPPVLGTNNSLRYHGASVYYHGVIQNETDPNTLPSIRFSPESHPHDRAEKARAMIEARYSNKPKVKLQVLREMEEDIGWRETQAGLVLSCNLQGVQFNIVGDRILICDKSGSPLGKGCVALVRHAEESRPQDSAKPEPEPSKPERENWSHRFLRWIGILHEVAVFFRDVRQSTKSNDSGPEGPKSNAWANVWGRFRGWWTRSSADPKESE